MHMLCMVVRSLFGHRKPSVEHSWEALTLVQRRMETRGDSAVERGVGVAANTDRAVLGV